MSRAKCFSLAMAYLQQHKSQQERWLEKLLVVHFFTVLYFTVSLCFVATLVASRNYGFHVKC